MARAVSLARLRGECQIATGRPDVQVQSLMHALPAYAVLPANTTGEALLQLLARMPAAPTYALADRRSTLRYVGL